MVVGCGMLLICLPSQLWGDAELFNPVYLYLVQVLPFFERLWFPYRAAVYVFIALVVHLSEVYRSTVFFSEYSIFDSLCCHWSGDLGCSLCKRFTIGTHQTSEEALLRNVWMDHHSSAHWFCTSSMTYKHGIQCHFSGAWVRMGCCFSQMAINCVFKIHLFKIYVRLHCIQTPRNPTRLIMKESNRLVFNTSCGIET